RANTSVLVSDGQTTVIGGIYVSQEQAQTDRTPGLGQVPLLKWLFKRDSVNDQRTELLIFITPRIIQVRSINCMNQRSTVRTTAPVAVVAATISCGDVVRDGRSPVFVVIDALAGAKGNTPQAFSGFLQSDVLTMVTSGGTCSQTSPCPTIFNDVGEVTLRL